MTLPRLYAIVDVSCFGGDLRKVIAFAAELATAGATLVQYRNKIGSSREILSEGREMKRKLGSRTQFIMNDRPDLCLGADFDGVHLGQDDISVAGARKVLGQRKSIGLSTHNLAQFHDAAATSADYLALGPIFATRSKQDPDPEVGLKTVTEARKVTSKPIVAIGPIFATRSKDRPDPIVGLDGLKEIRTTIRKPLVAIGGITLANCRSVIDAGADSVATRPRRLPRSTVAASRTRPAAAFPAPGPTRYARRQSRAGLSARA